MRRLTLLLIPIAVILIPAEAPAPTSPRPTIAWPAAVKRVVFVCADIIAVRAWCSASAAAALASISCSAAARFFNSRSCCAWRLALYSSLN
jgi:hypothetical protein